MSQKIKLDNELYSLDGLSSRGTELLELLKFATERERELSNMQALLERAKKSYIKSLTKEMLTQKSGFLFENE